MAAGCPKPCTARCRAGACLSDLGWREEALAAIEEAVQNEAIAFTAGSAATKRRRDSRLA